MSIVATCPHKHPLGSFCFECKDGVAAPARHAGAIASLTDDHGKLLAQCNALRERLIDLLSRIDQMPMDIKRWREIVMPSEEAARQALAQTPEQSLEAYKDGVLEEAAGVADNYPDRDPGEDGNGYWAAEEIAKAIRAMKKGV